MLDEKQKGTMKSILALARKIEGTHAILMLHLMGALDVAEDILKAVDPKDEDYIRDVKEIKRLISMMWDMRHDISSIADGAQYIIRANMHKPEGSG